MPEEPRGASWAAAGMLAPVTEAHYGEEALLRLNLTSAEMYSQFAAEVQEDSGIDPGYRACGTIVAARDTDDIAALEDLFAFQQRLGLRVEWLRTQRCRELEPHLSPRVRGGILVEGDHQVDNRALLASLQEAARARGVRVLKGTAAGLEVDGDRVCGVALEDGTKVEVDAVVLAAGVWSSAIAGVPREAVPNLRPVKGQLLHLRGPRFLTRNVRGLDVYIVPRADGRVVVGATMEERGYDLRPTAEGAYELLRDAYELVPGLLELEIVEHEVGLRPATPDNAPLIGPTALQGLLLATGHFRNGVLLAPVTATAIVAMLMRSEPSVDLTPFSPLRFAVRSAAAS